MRGNFYYPSRSKIIIIILIVIGVLLLAGLGYWGGKKLFKKDDEITYYKVLLIFVDENTNFVEGVNILSDGKLVHTTKNDGKYESKYVKKGTTFSFHKEGYQLGTDSLKVEKNIHLQQVSLISNDSLRQKIFTIKIIDINGLPVKSVNVNDGKTNLGSTDNLGEFKLQLLEGTKNLSFKISGEYFSIPNVTINYGDDSSQVVVLRADFNLEKYMQYTDPSEETHTRDFTVGFDFRTPDGRRLKNVTINYKLKDVNTFKVGAGYSIVFENEVFETAFAYVYDDINSVWLCSPIIKTSPIGGDIFMEEAIAIQAEVDIARSNVYTSNGYYFVANDDTEIQIVIPSYESIKFYKEIEYNIFKYELILVDDQMEPILSVDKSISEVKFILK